VRRREFITLLGGAAIAWPLAAHAQQSEKRRRIGVLTGSDQSDAEEQVRFGAFRQSLQQLGWMEGRNIQFDFRSRSGGNIAHVRKNVAELVALGPDVILVTGSNNLGALQEATRTISSVFVGLKPLAPSGNK
jgi:putative tryptophan/tyrosine transport system substrate-binding protein